MPAGLEVTSFIRSTFRSVWALELLCLLRKDPERGWTQDGLVSALRASDLVVAQGLAPLVGAGLVVTAADDQVRYQPATEALDALAQAAEALYASSPDKVRRLILSSYDGGASAFADAFRVRKE
jgi:hypothetical protein